MNAFPPSGLLLVDKPEGPTSRAIVDRVVRRLGTRRAGHAGTLDPFAGGLLLVAFGRATGLVRWLQEYEKQYEAEAEFGRVTDSQDRTGITVRTADPSGLDETSVRAALEAFRGRVRQRPPMYSAVRHAGRRLHELARAGVTVEREERERDVSRFELTGWDPPRASFTVACQGGTYVRTLVHDLGERLGPGAHLTRLVRVAVGPHRLGDAIPASALEEASDAEIGARIVPPAGMLPDRPALPLLSEGEVRAVRHGSWRDPGGLLAGGGEWRLLDREGALLALARGGPEVRLLRVLGEEGG